MDQLPAAKTQKFIRKISFPVRNVVAMASSSMVQTENQKTERDDSFLK